MLDVAKVVKPINEDAGDFDLVTRSSNVDQIVLAHDFFLARDSARWNGAWRLLDCQLLIVLVDGVGFINHVRSLLLTYHA